MSETYDASKAIAAQREYVKESGAPHFAPEHGHCWSCGQNIYASKVKKRINFKGEEIEQESGITVEEAGSKLITGCPHCNRCYCD